MFRPAANLISPVCLAAKAAVSKTTSRTLSSRTISSNFSALSASSLPSSRQTIRPMRAFFSTESSSNSSSDSNSSSSNNSDSKSEKDKVHDAQPIIKTAEQEQIEKLIADNKSLRDQLLRALAEEENVRRIARRDVDNAKQFSISSFAKSLLEIADNLDMAVETFPKEKRASEDKSVNVLLEGVEMTNKNFQKVFGKFGIVKFGTVGDKFDPALHNALFNIPNPDKEANTLGQVLKTGYKLNDRVIRAADVGCFQKP